MGIYLHREMHKPFITHLGFFAGLNIVFVGGNFRIFITKRFANLLYLILGWLFSISVHLS
ncbi:hypothetical protein C2G38_2110814 [Gigaspora rosea]|uniref:Uncharacterized protein n=1 Tax=Gigaspora rosea TaxID=44941 RepID=A0A397UN62_9GLOM|nr:hypothetical protein C2G38_2110814 [Gigaspora rosea]